MKSEKDMYVQLLGARKVQDEYAAIRERTVEEERIYWMAVGGVKMMENALGLSDEDYSSFLTSL